MNGYVERRKAMKQTAGSKIRKKSFYMEKGRRRREQSEVEWKICTTLRLARFFIVDVFVVIVVVRLQLVKRADIWVLCCAKVERNQSFMVNCTCSRYQRQHLSPPPSLSLAFG